MHHILAMGTEESDESGNERIDLVAYRVDTNRFGDWATREEVCTMSARRSFGLKLTNGFVVVEQESLRSLNIGSLCFNEVVKWARRVAPDDSVIPTELLASHVGSYKPENLERRHRFYRQFGLEFEFTNRGAHALASGISKPIVGRDLVTHPMSKYPNIVEIELVSAVQQLAMRQEGLEDDVSRLEGAVSRLLAERRRRSDRVVKVAQLLRWPLVCASFAAGAILARPDHFGLHL
ncbi:hypothetical protein [Paraburkholderia bryophila]|uniref:GNAT superfamily N-acetyltransferase n=1 Tax=Paraburkholderia bryophila TaxID=420952 RepID=A0A7Z0BB29_9BURK|nr:hypothetical protein [Paraburkholderia bryophila]NYH26002.1 GNAT superfamily N-acetyltransferase [Paraburkholderia bryophila]